MAIERLFDVHSLVRLRVVGEEEMCLGVGCHLDSFVVGALESMPDIVIEPYEPPRQSIQDMVFDDYAYASGVLHRPENRIWFDYNGSPQVYRMDRLQFPINLLIELALLRDGLTFVHGAAVSIDGKGVLFPALPGTGKTTLVAAFVRAGALMLGDDLCIIGNGKLYSYPQSLSVYPHHMSVLGFSDRHVRRVFRRAAVCRRLAAPLKYRGGRVAGLGRAVLAAIGTASASVSPELVFGTASIGSTVHLSQVVALQRSGDVRELVAEVVEAGELAKVASVTLWHEWHASFHQLLLYDAVAEGGLGMIGRIERVRELMSAEWRCVPCARVLIPSSWDSDRLAREFPEFWNRTAS